MPAPTRARESEGPALSGRATAHLPVRALTGAELDDLAGPRRDHPETVAGTVLSWFDDHGADLVTAAKQAAVLRPHGQILRPLGEHDVTTTVWMDGSFCSHLTRVTPRWDARCRCDRARSGSAACTGCASPSTSGRVGS
ncbi:hypothetical protein [Ornithinimicrobium cerasi]|uniref:hypothetical protein n=1 Tax=Ornithinimicrobium cerasi TaxID=2248773 RepID=UPI001379808B|nr:hypothetical protein [Ornithinimicrobium cerasi]